MQAKYEYRYRDNAGSTLRSINALDHLPKIGTPTELRGYCHRSTHNNRLAVLVRGKNGTARFSSFCWGYNGEGPRGLMELFSRLRIPLELAEYVAHKSESPDWSRPREYWRLQLHPSGGYDLYLYDKKGRVVGHREYTLQMKEKFQLQLAM